MDSQLQWRNVIKQNVYAKTLRPQFSQSVCSWTFERQWMAGKKRWQRNRLGFGANVAFTEGAASCFQASSKAQVQKLLFFSGGFNTLF